MTEHNAAAEPNAVREHDAPAEVGVAHRSGFAAFVGRPNAGKSTLTNAMVGSKIVITSDKPQTTRRAVRGVLSRPNGQLIIVDTPGLHRPRTLLGERLNDVVRSTLADVDVIAFVVPANEKIGPGDKFIANEVSECRAPVVGVVSKTDTVSKQQVLAQLIAMSELADFAEIVPVSAKSGDQVDLLSGLLIGQLPLGPALYPNDVETDETDTERIADLIREAALADVFDELPHSIAVTISEIVPRNRVGSADDMKNGNELLDIFATLHLERSSQKPIILGPGGRRLRDIGIQAREGIEQLLGRRVHLDLRVSVMADWQRDAKKLDRLGF